METIFYSILATWKVLLLWLLGFAVAFSLLAKVCACNPEQPLRRNDIATDLLYCFLMPILTRFIRAAFLSVGIYMLFHGDSQAFINDYIINGYGPLSRLPVWLQAALIFIISDIMLYWLHRGFHGKSMWHYHAIHHSPKHVDWLSTYRFHPINSWLSFTLVDALMLLVGFSPAAVAAMAGFNMIYSALVHANLNWTFGPFKYVLASPVFHRWHHTSRVEGMNKNFAPTFPLLDIVFGTFYMPEDRLPGDYGVSGSDIPESFLGQIIWPFRQKKKMD